MSSSLRSTLLLGIQVCKRFAWVSQELIRVSDVQKFAVWEKDAKDESGFVGYCYLDLFPRSKYTCSRSPHTPLTHTSLP